MQGQSTQAVFLSPGSVDPGVAVAGVAKNRVGEKVQVSPDLVGAPGAGRREDQRRTRLISATESTHNRLGLLDDATVVFEGFADGDGLGLSHISSHMGQIVFRTRGQRLV